MVFEPGDPSKRLEERKPRSTSEKWQRRSLKPPKAQIEDEKESIDSEDEEMRWYRRKKRDQLMKTEVLHESDPTTDEAHLKIKGKIDTEEFEFYVDTGSKYSLLTKDDFGTLSNTTQAKIRMSPVREIRGASGADTVRPLGLLEVELLWGELTTFVEFIVVPTLNKSILGLRWMQANEILLRSAHSEIVVRDKTIEIFNVCIVEQKIEQEFTIDDIRAVMDVSLMHEEQDAVLNKYEDFQRAVMYHLHGSRWSGHCGSVKTRRRARKYVWWPGLDQDIDQYLRQCALCI